MALAEAEAPKRRGRPPGIAPRRRHKLQVTYSDDELQIIDRDMRASGADSYAQVIRWRTVGHLLGDPQSAA